MTSFPCPSTSNFHTPQLSHRAGANCDCSTRRNARNCNHCKRELNAASDGESRFCGSFPEGKIGASCKAWSDKKLKGYAAERFPNVKALRAPRALRPPQRTVSHCGTATGRHDQTRCTFGCAGAPSFGAGFKQPPPRGVLDEAGAGRGL